NRLMQATFGLLGVLILGTYAIESVYGAKSWAGMWRISGVGDLPAGIGPLSLLPGLIILLWVASRLLKFPPDRQKWTWGRRDIALPLLALSALIAFRLYPDVGSTNSFQVVVLMGLVWFVFLFVVNEQPNLVVPLALTVTIQGAVAIGQFLLQRDLGLFALGEPALDRMVPGVSILMAMGTRWLRAYGLTGHPNLLGTTVAVALLILFPAFRRARGLPQVVLGLAMLVGFLGLLVSFSRAAWLGFAMGMLVWLIGGRIRGEQGLFGSMSSLVKPRFVVGILLLLLAGFLFRYHELVTSRFLINSGYTEMLSLTDRLRDSRLALEIIAAHPWRGSGAGKYFDEARSLDEGAQIVHNVPLLMTAELGIPGAVLWLWLVVACFRGAKSESSRVFKDAGSGKSGHHDSLFYIEVIAPWVAFLVIGLFDYNPWPFVLMRGAVLFGSLAAQIAAPYHLIESK
ncbi:MAG: O-antigen ligase family protein, partial [Dehalococcoidia bacterium]|nr:O-antigen ligase family protein [Dehalococcoidia bacterium]